MKQMILFYETWRLSQYQELVLSVSDVVGLCIDWLLVTTEIFPLNDNNMTINFTRQRNTKNIVISII